MIITTCIKKKCMGVYKRTITFKKSFKKKNLTIEALIDFWLAFEDFESE